MKLNEDEANGASEDTSPGRDNNNPNYCNCNSDDNVNGNVDADLEKVDRCARGNHHGDCIVVDWLKGESCIKCNSQSGKVLVCGENGCPVAFHVACMTWKPDFDDKGKFYCPYCLFKQEGDRVKEFRMKSISAGKELSDYICLRRDGGREEKREGKKPMSEEKSDELTAHGVDEVENGERIEEVEEDERVNMEGASVSETAKKASSGDCRKELNNDDKGTLHHNPDKTQGVESIKKEKSDEGSIVGADGFEDVVNEKRMQEDIENSYDYEDDSLDLVSKTLVAGEKHDEQTAHGFDSVENGERIEDVEEDERVNLAGASVLSETEKKASSDDCENRVNNDDKETNHYNPDETRGVGSINKEKSDVGSISRTAGFENVGNEERMKEDIKNSFDTKDDSPDLVSKTLVAGKKHDEQTADKAQPSNVVPTDKSSFQPSTSAKNTNMNREGNTKRLKISAGRRKSSEQLTIPIMVGTEKRRRLNWTAEEDDMQKDLVHDFSSEVNINMSDFICSRRDSGSEEKRQGVKPMSEEKSDEKTAHEFDDFENGERVEEVEEDERVNLEGASVSETEKKASSGDCGKGLVNDDKETLHHNHNKTQAVELINKEKSDEESISRADGFENVGNGERMEEDIENFSDTEDNSPDLVSKTRVAGKKDDEQTGHGFGNVENGERIEEVEEEERVNGKENFDEGNISGADGFENVGNGERMEEDLVTETLVVGQKHDKKTTNKAQAPKVVLPDKSSCQLRTSAKNMNMNREGKTVTVKISAECQKSTKRPLIPIMSATEKRRRLHWTAEEEDMLKDLVQEYSMKVNKNIPWRKILEQGRSVFHSTRMPADLKDKWKNMAAKEIPKG